mmetsp:Transcript_462/g.760  ORF Transcript_462/g.760 Transcript_462/m.760 type:complete len:790 (-) Transcript_462:293-2662(-)
MDDTSSKVPKIKVDLDGDETLVFFPSCSGAVKTESNLVTPIPDIDLDVDAEDEEVMPHFLLQQQLKSYFKSRKEMPTPDKDDPSSKPKSKSNEDEELILLRCTMTTRLVLQQEIKAHFNWTHLHKICDQEKNLLLFKKQYCESTTSKTMNTTSDETETIRDSPSKDWKFSSIHGKMETLLQFKNNRPDIEPLTCPLPRIPRHRYNSKFSRIHSKMEKLLQFKNNKPNTKSINHSQPRLSRIRLRDKHTLTLHKQIIANFKCGSRLQGIYGLEKVKSNEPTKVTKDSPPLLSRHNGRPHCNYKYTLIHGTVFPNGNTVLHEILNVGSAPRSLTEKILLLWRGALWKRNKYGDTPLHVATRNAQMTSHRVQILVEACCNVADDLSNIDSASATYGDPPTYAPRCGASLSISSLARPISTLELLQYQNKAGETPLGTACASVASFTVLKLLVAKCPRALNIRNSHGHTPIEAMWISFQKNFLGTSSIVKYLSAHKKYGISHSYGINRSAEGDLEMPEMSQFLQKFWSKFCFCIMKSFEYDHRYHRWKQGKYQKVQSYRSCIVDEARMIEEYSGGDGSDQETYQDHPMLIHAILAHGIKQDLSTLLSIALSCNPDLGMQVDSDGNTPLHTVVSLSSVSLNRITKSNRRSSTFHSQHICTQTRPPITCDNKSIKTLLAKCRRSAAIANDSGRLSLHLALDKYWDADEGIRNGFWRNQRICDIMTANADVLEYFDPVGGSATVTNIDASNNNGNNDGKNSTKYFYPFMVAALYSDVEMTYEMLKRKPMVIFHANM